MSKPTSTNKSVDDRDILLIKVVGARNLTPMNKTGTADSYCIVKSTFNKQSFKTNVVKKSSSPVWNQEFTFYTSQLTGHMLFRLWNREKWSYDEFLGESAYALKNINDVKPIEEWIPITKEPKKSKKIANKPSAELHIIIHFPSGIQTPPLQNAILRKTPITDKYLIGKEIGRGGFSIVKEAKCYTNGESYAVKIIQKNTFSNDVVFLRREIEIMQKLHHKNIIELYEVYEDEKQIYLILELVTGGELFDQLVLRKSYSEMDAAAIVKQILDAVQYMHSNGIAHRDLKPENLLVTGLDKNQIKITDFGLSKDFGNSILSTSCGTPDYVAPEVLISNTAYDNSVDIWSLGVITYILLCGYFPFYGNNDQEVFEKILKLDYHFPKSSWRLVSDNAINFIKSILVLDASKRPTAAEALNHPWMICNAPSGVLSTFKTSSLDDYNQERRKKKRRQ